MPEFDSDESRIEITPDEFLDKCDSFDMKDLADALILNGSIKLSSLIIKSGKRYTYNELVYIEAICKLTDKWNRLSAAEEEMILNISKRF